MKSITTATTVQTIYELGTMTYFAYGNRVYKFSGVTGYGKGPAVKEVIGPVYVLINAVFLSDVECKEHTR